MVARLGRLIGKVSDIPRYRYFAIALSVVVFAILELTIHQSLEGHGLAPLLASLIDSGILGAAAGLAVWALLAGNCERRAKVRQELERIAELNHEIRNALQVISHSHYDAEVQHRNMVMDSVARIDAVLKRVYPITGCEVPLSDAPEGSRLPARRSGSVDL